MHAAGKLVTLLPGSNHTTAEGTVELENSTLWFSSQAQSIQLSVIEQAEAAQIARADIKFAYGSQANPNGATAASSELGVINGILIPSLPSSSSAAQTLQPPDNGVPCMLRETVVLKELPEGVVVVNEYGATTTKGTSGIGNTSETTEPGAARNSSRFCSEEFSILHRLLFFSSYMLQTDPAALTQKF